MKKQVEICARESFHDGFYPVDKLKLRHTLFRGGWSPVLEREIYGRTQPVVVVVLYDPHLRETLLLEQLRIGPLEYVQNEKAWLLEPVAGHADAGETLRQACVREVREETGLLIAENQLEKIVAYYPSPGGGRERITLFAAACSLKNIAEYGGLSSEQEDIRLHRLHFKTVEEYLQNGLFQVASTLIGMQWLIYRKWPEISQ